MRSHFSIAAVIVLTSASLAWADAPFEKTFADKVQPFLKQHCLACHGPDKQKGGVRFDGPMPSLVDVAQRSARGVVLLSHQKSILASVEA